jgi:hypothetical protein
MTETIQKQATDLRATLDRLTHLLNGRGPMPDLALARLAVDLDRMSSQLGRHLDRLGAPAKGDGG